MVRHHPPPIPQQSGGNIHLVVLGTSSGDLEVLRRQITLWSTVPALASLLINAVQDQPDNRKPPVLLGKTTYQAML